MTADGIAEIEMDRAVPPLGKPIVSRYVADDVGRILYKPYPDVIVFLADIQNSSGTAQDKRQLPDGMRPRLVARSWIVAD